MKRCFIVGIAGGSGSGKSTLARNLSEALGGVLLIAHDDYYKVVDSPREDYNYDHPSAYDNALLISHLDSLLSGEEVRAPMYDYRTHSRREETRLLSPSEVVIIEGILTLECEELRRRMDYKIFVDTPEEERLARRLIRDVNKRSRTPESVLEQFSRTVKPMHDRFVEPSRIYADRIIEGGGKSPEVIKELSEFIRNACYGEPEKI